ncbi:ATP binding [Pseudocyphellaria aurata]|nr:ATP binding [Pseudocyphellaria aurata]
MMLTTNEVNNVTGNNLIECDQAVLKEMGIKKIGDRVRIFVAIKQLRTRAIGNHKKRTRDSIAALDNGPRNTPYTPSSSGSPWQSRPVDSRRRSRIIEPAMMEPYYGYNAGPRPTSPLPESEGRGYRGKPYGGMSPVESPRKDQQLSASTVSGRHPPTPNRQNPSMDATVGKLTAGLPHIRVIYNSGQTKVLDIKNCSSPEQIMFNVLKKLGLNEQHSRSYCFYTLSGTNPDPANCYRLSDADLVRVCRDTIGSDRGRLILRKIHAGEPNEEELRKAASISVDETIAINSKSSRKLQRIAGESWETISNPLSPAPFQLPRSAGERHRSGSSVAQDWDVPERADSRRSTKPKIKEFNGGRPPSELISQELTTYFPDHEKATIERTVRLSMRRSARLSKAASRMSMASNLSFASSLKDAPPLPNIADAWLTGVSQARGPRPLSVSRFALPQAAYRDSTASTSLQPLQEESPLEPNRKSYVSFDSDSQPNNMNVIDSEGHSYFDESGSSGPTTDAGGSLNDHLSHAIAEDGEEPDEELDSFLKGDSWDNVKWMQGALIGQGSFGSVFLALHAVTGELMAVKQVEVPSNTNSILDKRKESMVAALKREIDLLRDLQHENIVQYLGSNSDEQHFNIFLEYVPGGSVAAMLNSYGQLQEPLIRNFVRQILAGLSYLHGRDIIHRDIKGANVLVDNKGSIKISDFGISKRVEASALLQPGKNGGHVHRPSLQGSVFWMAPEVVKQTSYTRKADIWSLGCLIVEMFTGTHPFPNCSQLQAIFQIGNSSAKPSTPENASEEGQAFLKQTFEIDHEKRPSADELMLSPFLKQIA